MPPSEPPIHRMKPLMPAAMLMASGSSGADALGCVVAMRASGSLRGRANERRHRVAHGGVVVHAAVAGRAGGGATLGHDLAGTGQLADQSTPGVRRQGGNEVLLHAEQRGFLVVLERARYQVQQRVSVRGTGAVATLGGVG